MAKAFLIIGASIFGLLGIVHLVFTFFSDKFLARDPSVVEAMKRTSPVLTPQTTMWNAWIGFNASHSLGAIFFAAIYLLLATFHMDVLEESKIFVLLGVAVCLFYLFLARRYWFRVPLMGIAVATGCFMASAVLTFF